MLFLIKVLKNASAARLRSTARWVQAQCGRKMLTIYLDMAWCALRHGAGYCDYANFGFWQLTERQRATYVTRFRNKRILDALNQQRHYEDFNNKLNRVLKEISNVLAIPQPIEEERKYIVKLTGEVPNAIDSDIVQTYLTGEPGSEIRLRRRGFEGGKYVYVHTTKKRISDNEQIETERQINANLYENMLQQADPYRQRIHKHRKSFIWKGQYFELDEFLEPVSDLMILETRGISANESVKFPPFIQVLEDITGNSKYYNYNIALKR